MALTSELRCWKSVVSTNKEIGMSITRVAFFFLQFALFSLDLSADSSDWVDNTINWTNRTYRATLPSPFDDIVFSIDQDKDRNLIAMTLKFGDHNVQIEERHLQGVQVYREPELVFDPVNPANFRIAAEFGNPILVQNTSGICEDDCVERLREVMVIELDSHGGVLVRKFVPDI